MSDYDRSGESEDERAAQVFSDEEPARHSGSGSEKDNEEKDDKPKRKARQKKTGPVRRMLLSEEE